MDLNPYLQQLREDLLAAVALADESTRTAAAAVANALEPSMRLALLSALTDLTAEVNAALAEHRDATGPLSVDLRLAGREVDVVVTRPATEAPDPGPAEDAGPGRSREFRFTPGPDWVEYGSERKGGPDPADLRKAMDDAAGELSRTTVRLFQDLKNRAETAASAEGVSLNAFISRAISQAVSGDGPRRHGPGRRGPGRWGAPPRRVSGWIST